MTPENQRIALAMFDGWVWYRTPMIPSDRFAHRALFHPQIHEYQEQSDIWKVRADGTERMCNWDYMAKEGYVPDYLHDLRAMNVAEEKLTPEQWVEYAHQLAAVTSPKLNNPYQSALAWEVVWLILHASASQRAEALLKTIGKWEDEPCSK